ncbi:MAG: trypsin-like peptidase domain-containing protein [Pseudomonadota bacterium]
MIPSTDSKPAIHRAACGQRSFMQLIRLSFASLLLFGLACASQGVAASDHSLSALFKRVGPAVVIVRTSTREIPALSEGRQVRVAGLGSGVLVDKRGRVITAAHVVQTADAVSVEFPGNVLIYARVIASDAASDVALLQLERVPPGIIPAQLGDSDMAEVGDQVFVVGAPLGIGHTLTVGHLSARRRPNTTYGGIAPTELFQTDTAINQGNSGGPMFNMKGEVIGIVSHIVSRSGGSEGMGFVVTSNMATRLLLDEPSVWNGLDGYLLAGGLAKAFNIPAALRAGLLVQRVAEGSPAEQLGLRGGSLPVRVGDDHLLLGGDIILAVNGIGVDDPGAYENIRRRLIEMRAGGDISVTVLRAGETVELTATVVKP